MEDPKLLPYKAVSADHFYGPGYYDTSGLMDHLVRGKLALGIPREQAETEARWETKREASWQVRRSRREFGLV